MERKRARYRVDRWSQLKQTNGSPPGTYKECSNNHPYQERSSIRVVYCRTTCAAPVENRHTHSLPTTKSGREGRLLTCSYVQSEVPS